ncbi:nucleotidyl transferase AbiEii/AbiGii toxin family protein [bacterium]|nr:nucleotidyl transferase AbiEii/AbiGii toxin family protein [bacterium]
MVWQEQSYRVTKDADFLSFGDPNLDRLSEIFREICHIECSVKDGIVFLPESVKAQAIREDQAYDGVRIVLEGNLNKARVSLQIDVVTPSPDSNS